MYSTTNQARIDVATALYQGARDYQEDCIAADFPIGRENGFAILADGMGAHASGDIASSLIVGRVFAILKARFKDLEASERGVSDCLRHCVDQANASIAAHVKTHTDDLGMGATLVIALILNGRLFWASVGDSPLFIVRSGEIHQINEDHSMAPRIAAMVAAGQLSQEKAATHPDRNALTSVVFGKEVARVDCSDTPLELQDGDTIVLASDGLQTLRNAEILKTVRRHGQRGSYQLTDALLRAVEDHQSPDQDNTSIIVMKYAATEATAPSPHPTMTETAMPDERGPRLEAVDGEVEEASDALLEALAL